MKVESELIRRAQLGNSNAQEELVRQLSPVVFRLISRFFRTREDVEDLAQAVFLKMFSSLDQVRPDENFPGWLSRVTVNTCYDELRKIRRRKIAMETFGPKEIEEPIADPIEPDLGNRARHAVDSLDVKLRTP